MSFKACMTCLIGLAWGLNVQASEHQSIKREVDVNALQALVNQLSTQVQILEATVNAMSAKMAQMELQIEHQSSAVAFTGLAATDHMYHPHEAVTFNDILLDIGITYDNQTGVWTIPVSGLYLVSLRPDPTEGPETDIGLGLKVNGVETKIQAYADHSSAAGVSAAVNLQAGDIVQVVNAWDNRVLQAYSLFSIVLLTPS